MIALKITNIKQFMGKLLASEVFDVFLLEEASISTYNTFSIDGHQNKDFYSAEEWADSQLRPYDLSLWKTIRPICFDLIKGTHTPSAFRFVFHLIPEQVHTILEKADALTYEEQIKAFVLNIKYDGLSLTLITGTALCCFLPDKTPDLLWDSALKRFLTRYEISFEEL